MGYDLDITNKGIYLHVRIGGVECLSNFKDVWNRIGRECDKQASRRVLCEGCLEGSGMAGDMEIEEFLKDHGGRTLTFGQITPGEIP